MIREDRHAHDQAVELAARAIDFQLTDAQASALDAHLATCPVCSRSAESLRGDAIALRPLMTLLPSRRVDDAVFAAIEGRRTRSPNLVLLLAAALLAVALLGIAAAAGSLFLRTWWNPPTVEVPKVPVAVIDDKRSAEPLPTGVLPVAAGPLIAYSGRDGDTMVVRTVGPDGQGDRVLAEGVAPAWSPDGGSIAYGCHIAEANAAGRVGDVCVMTADGSDQRQVIADGVTPRWSPDGTRLMFSRSVIDAGDTWVANADGSSPTKTGDGAGSWSSDGALILLLGASGATPDATVVNADGTGPHKVGSCWGATWDPAGARVSCLGSDATGSTLEVVDATSGKVAGTFMTDATIGDPAWITSDLLALTMTRDGVSASAIPPENDLYLLDPYPGGHPRQLTNGLSIAGPIDATRDGSSLAFVVASDADTNDIYVISLTGEARRVTTDGTSTQPRWQPPAAGAAAAPTQAPAFAKLSLSGAVHLGSDVAGWASTATTLYRTDDGGTTWTDVRPPLPFAPDLAAAVGADTYYAPSLGPPATISVTHDGGASWTRAVIDAGSAGGGPFLSFRTPDHGFATFSTNGLDGLSVYETTDGGMTWTGPLESVVPLPSKFQGHAGGILSISNGKADNVPFDNRLLLSLDGGATWKERTFPIGAEAPKRELKWVTAVWDDGGGRIVLAIDLGDGDQLYVSDDDGGTWRFVRGWQSFPSGHLTVGFQVALLSATEWVVMATDGSRTWSTVDGGGEWRETAGTTKVVLDEISIASADHALAVHRCLTDQQAALGPDPVCDGARARSVLLVTSDGGGTWAPTGE